MNSGVDEAGRGPVLGPMVMAVVAISPGDEAILNKMGVKDSKKVPKNKRNKLSRIIRKHFPHVIIKVSPKDIDSAVTGDNDSLNLLEARTTTKLLNRLSEKARLTTTMIDLPSKNKHTYLQAVTLNLNTTIKIEAEFKADENYPAVAAASILAKVARDSSMATASKRLGINLGSGYPSDPVTKIALQKHLPTLLNSGICRQSWKTIHNAKASYLNTNSGGAN